MKPSTPICCVPRWWQPPCQILLSGAHQHGAHCLLHAGGPADWGGRWTRRGRSGRAAWETTIRQVRAAARWCLQPCASCRYVLSWLPICSPFPAPVRSAPCACRAVTAQWQQGGYGDARGGRLAGLGCEQGGHLLLPVCLLLRPAAAECARLGKGGQWTSCKCNAPMLHRARAVKLWSHHRC